MKIVLIDNYDSFTHILAQYLKEQDGVKITILQNDTFELPELNYFDKIVISPGPGIPSSAGNIIQVVRHFSGEKSVLGICLGLQAIYESFGGSLINLPTVQHGVTSMVEVIERLEPLFQGIESPFKAGRYHSWVCDPGTLPDCLRITAVDQQGTVMACRHKIHPTFGMQFHPESILTPDGKQMIKNFVKL